MVPSRASSTPRSPQFPEAPSLSLALSPGPMTDNPGGTSFQPNRSCHLKHPACDWSQKLLACSLPINPWPAGLAEWPSLTSSAHPVSPETHKWEEKVWLFCHHMIGAIRTDVIPGPQMGITPAEMQSLGPDDGWGPTCSCELAPQVVLGQPGLGIPEEAFATELEYRPACRAAKPQTGHSMIHTAFILHPLLPSA